jgi:hypothetical protein
MTVDLVRRHNEKRTGVSPSTINDRLEQARRLAGHEKEVEVLRPILTAWFAPRPLKKALMEYIGNLRLMSGFGFVDRLASRHLDVLILEFMELCPMQCREMLRAQGEADAPEVQRMPTTENSNEEDEVTFPTEGVEWPEEWPTLGEDGWTA